MIIRIIAVAIFAAIMIPLFFTLKAAIAAHGALIAVPFIAMFVMIAFAMERRRY